MGYQKLKCPKGHTFQAYIANRYSKVTCPQCKVNRIESDSSNSSWSSADTGSFIPTFTESSSSSSSTSDFSSGGGGDFGGGGSSGDW